MSDARNGGSDRQLLSWSKKIAHASPGTTLLKRLSTETISHVSFTGTALSLIPPERYAMVRTYRIVTAPGHNKVIVLKKNKHFFGFKDITLEKVTIS